MTSLRLCAPDGYKTVQVRYCALAPGPERHALGFTARPIMLSRSAALLLTLSAVAGLAPRSGAWSDDKLVAAPINSTSGFLASLEVGYSKRSVAVSEDDDASSRCNVSVERLPAKLVVRWDGDLGLRCDVLVYTTNSHGKAFFSAAFNRAASPVFIEHVGVAGAQQEFRLCIGCGLSRFRRFGRSRPDMADSVHFCCLDFALDELKGDRSWRLNRKPIESTLVACFMTLVIIIWSVAALIWPVPIIAGFLPNGMEQRRPR